MQIPQYCVRPEIFKEFPGYSRGVLLAFGVVNGDSPPELLSLLREAEESIRGKIALESLTEQPRIKSWRDAYRAFGAKPSEFRSSIEALARRALRNQPLPTINKLVDIGNIVSLRYLVPVGGHAIDVVKTDIELRPATGREAFVAFGSEEEENPLPGEIIFTEGNTVLTRRWTWRQANHTILTRDSKDVEFNVDALPPASPQEAKEILLEVEGLVTTFCGGKIRHDILTTDNPTLPLSL